MELESHRVTKDKVTITPDADESIRKIAVHGVFDIRVKLSKAGTLNVYIKMDEGKEEET